MVEIRKMRDGEAEQVLELWNENCLEAAGRGLSESEAAQVLALLRQYLFHNETLCLVAAKESKPVAFLTACLASHPVMAGRLGEIEGLYVQPPMRRSGIGSELVRQAVSLMRQQGASTIRVHFCAESPTAMEFWRHLGWEQDLVTFSLYEA